MIPPLPPIRPRLLPFRPSSKRNGTVICVRHSHSEADGLFSAALARNEQNRTSDPVMIWRLATAIAALVFCCFALSAACPTALAASEVYIRQARGHVAPGSTVITKPTPETTGQAAQPAAAPTTAPDTCNAQNAASSQACYTATQQARPASR